MDIIVSCFYHGLPEYENAIQNNIKLNPKWIAFSCLMNDSL